MESHVRRVHSLLGTALAVLLLAVPVASAQTPAPDLRKAAVIHQILEEIHAADQMIAVMEAALPAQRAALPNIPAVFWDRFMAAARAQRSQLVETIVPIYSQRFDLTELEQLLAFYKTPLGQRLLAVQPAIIQDSAQAGQAWGARLGKEIGEQLAREGVVVKP
jgi:hypothetical protein